MDPQQRIVEILKTILKKHLGEHFKTESIITDITTIMEIMYNGKGKCVFSDRVCSVGGWHPEGRCVATYLGYPLDGLVKGCKFEIKPLSEEELKSTQFQESAKEDPVVLGGNYTAEGSIITKGGTRPRYSAPPQTKKPEDSDDVPTAEVSI